MILVGEHKFEFTVRLWLEINQIKLKNDLRRFNLIKVTWQRSFCFVVRIGLTTIDFFALPFFSGQISQQLMKSMINSLQLLGLKNKEWKNLLSDSEILSELLDHCVPTTMPAGGMSHKENLKEARLLDNNVFLVQKLGFTVDLVHNESKLNNRHCLNFKITSNRNCTWSCLRWNVRPSPIFERLSQFRRILVGFDSRLFLWRDPIIKFRSEFNSKLIFELLRGLNSARWRLYRTHCKRTHNKCRISEK